MPTYHLAVVVDDHLMEITHILRGEEWLPSAPLHVLVYEAFGWEKPEFVHLPVILDPSGKGKMSKRKPVVDGREMPVFVSDFMDEGYLPDAVFNFLTNTGWSFDAEREIFTRAEAVARFDVRDISAKSTALDYKKLEWLNGVYIRAMQPAELKSSLLPFVAAELGMDEAALAADERFDHLIPLIQERIKLLGDVATVADFFFVRELAPYDVAELIPQKGDLAMARRALESAQRILAGAEFTHDGLDAVLRAGAQELKVKAGQMFQPIRVAVCGRKNAPPLFETLETLGRETCLERIAKAIQMLED